MDFVGESGEKLAFVVGDRGASSNSVSMALSSIPTDLAVLLGPYPECEDELAERFLISIRGEYAEPDDLEVRDEEMGNLVPSIFGASLPSS